MPLDRTTHALLLRQLYLSHYEQGRFAKARVVATQALELEVLVDVFHEDAARAAMGEGDVNGAVSHLRRAARRGPASRRPFHLWTLGSLLFLEHRYAEAITALELAVRCGTGDNPLFRAHLALVRIAAGIHSDDVQASIDDLAAAPCGQGYGRFVLGHLAYAAQRWDVAEHQLQAFIERTRRGGVARTLALDGELRMALATLSKMSRN
jgi:tetratricopeptide (TPR) repeat protein